MPGSAHLPALDHINIVVTDIDRSTAFYAALLGLVPIMDRVLAGGWFEQVTGLPGARARCVILDSPGGGCRIELLRFDGPARPAPSEASRPATIGLRHVAVRVADLDASLAALRRWGGGEVAVTDVPGDIVRGGKRMCYIHDPDGAIVELCEYGSARPEFC